MDSRWLFTLLEQKHFLYHVLDVLGIMKISTTEKCKADAFLSLEIGAFNRRSYHRLSHRSNFGLLRWMGGEEDQHPMEQGGEDLLSSATGRRSSEAILKRTASDMA